jgi:hypothetical protein
MHEDVYRISSTVELGLLLGNPGSGAHLAFVMVLHGFENYIPK